MPGAVQPALYLKVDRLLEQVRIRFPAVWSLRGRPLQWQHSNQLLGRPEVNYFFFFFIFSFDHKPIAKFFALFLCAVAWISKILPAKWAATAPAPCLRIWWNDWRCSATLLSTWTKTWQKVVIVSRVQRLHLLLVHHAVVHRSSTWSGGCARPRPLSCN